MNYVTAFACFKRTEHRLRKDGYEIKKQDISLGERIKDLGVSALKLSVPVINIITPFVLIGCNEASYDEYKDFLIKEYLVKRISDDEPTVGSTKEESVSEPEKSVDRLLYVDKVNGVAYIEHSPLSKDSKEGPKVLRKTFRPNKLSQKVTNE